MNLFEEMEEAIRQRGVRVEDRLALLRAVRDVQVVGDDAAEMLGDRGESLLAAVKDAADAVVGKVSG